MLVSAQWFTLSWFLSTSWRISTPTATTCSQETTPAEDQVTQSSTGKMNFWWMKCTWPDGAYFTVAICHKRSVKNQFKVKSRCCLYKISLGFFSPIVLPFWWSRCKRKGNVTTFWAFYFCCPVTAVIIVHFTKVAKQWYFLLLESIGWWVTVHKL